MTSLEVLGAAVIWLSAGFLLMIIAGFTLEAALGWLNRRRVQRAVWMYRDEFVDQEALDDFLRHEARKWWRAHAKEKAWSRSSDYQAGMRAAARHLLRWHTSITLVRRDAPRPKSDAPTSEELVRMAATLRKYEVEV